MTTVHRLRPLLIGVAVLYLLGIALSAFVLPAPLPAWAVFFVWLVAGALLAAILRPARWWVTLGFLWLGAAWVEAGQAVWLELRGSVSDVALGCLGSALGVAIITAARTMHDRRAAKALSARSAGAPPRR